MQCKPESLHYWLEVGNCFGHASASANATHLIYAL